MLSHCNVSDACGHRSCSGNIFDTIFYLSNRSRNPNLEMYEIPVGGMSVVGEWGYIDAFREMMEQVGAVICMYNMTWVNHITCYGDNHNVGLKVTLNLIFTGLGHIRTVVT